MAPVAVKNMHSELQGTHSIQQNIPADDLKTAFGLH